jgi:hypothetical protein
MGSALTWQGDGTGPVRHADAPVSISVPDYLEAAPARRGRHRVLVLADQAASSLSNVLVTVLAASTTSPTTFGRFAIAMVGYQLALGVVRSVVGEPLLSEYSAKGPRARRRIVADVQGTTIFVASMCSLFILVLSRFSEPGLRGAFVGLAVVLPFVLVQDIWRYVFIIDRPGAALVIDVVWLVGVVLALSFVPEGSGPGHYVLAWGASGALGALGALVLGGGMPTLPHPWKWMVGHREMCWRYLTEFATAQGVAQLGFAGLAALSGAAALGAARAAWVVYGVLVVANSSLYMVLVPEGARERDRPERLPRMFAMASLGAMALALCWMLAAMVIPDSVGGRLFGDTWEQADRLLLPMGLTMVAGGALSGAMLGIRALGDARRSLAARLRSAPFQAVCPLAGAVVADAKGFVFGLAAGNVIAALTWWAAFLQATSERGQRRSRWKPSRRGRPVPSPHAAAPATVRPGPGGARGGEAPIGR